jgi:hypothetical protein
MDFEVQKEPKVLPRASKSMVALHVRGRSRRTQRLTVARFRRVRTADTSRSIWAIEMASVPLAKESLRIAAMDRASERGPGLLRRRWAALVFTIDLLAL